MRAYQRTWTWRSALAPQERDPYTEERELLRVTYERVRSRAQILAESIAVTLPEFTVHDISHADALWEYTDLIAGPRYELTPTEAFVLGCTFLIHDLGMGLAAYPDGLDTLKKSELWQDVSSIMRLGMGSFGSLPDESSTEKRVLAEVLRRRHADVAAQLPSRPWRGIEPSADYYLIDDADLRNAFAVIIGRISNSHWWPAEDLIASFPAILGAQTTFPATWTVDALKIACILRCVDYCHIDERRAPAFLGVLRHPAANSALHWKFQEKLYRPRLDQDRLIFTSKSPFTIEDANAWWLCYDTLTAIDLELQKVDSVLADAGRERLAAGGVAHVASPKRLAQLVTVDGWEPVEARVKVSNVARIVEMLGGKGLYGDDLDPALRELIQNAGDAVRARRLIEDRPLDWGEIRVSRGSDDSGSWIQVDDCGVGMSDAVLTGALLDFGESFWQTAEVWDELPGLASKGFKASGRYGIGFFSVFTWGERVSVRSRRFDSGTASTRVLEFANALHSRPLLRKARRDEQLAEPGTSVRVWLSEETASAIAAIGSLGDWCMRIAPCLDVTLVAGDASTVPAPVIVANDWLTIEDAVLVRRLMPTAHYPEPAPKLDIVRSSDGRVVGRAALWPAGGVVTVDGLRAGAAGGILGVMNGRSTRAARDKAAVDIGLVCLQEWVREQCAKRAQEGHTQEVVMNIAEYAADFGIIPTMLPIAYSLEGWLTFDEVVLMACRFSEVYVVDYRDVRMTWGDAAHEVELNSNVLVSSTYSVSWSFNREGWSCGPWPRLPLPDEWRSLPDRVYSLEGLIVRALVKGWGDVSVADVLAASSLSRPYSIYQPVGVMRGEKYEENVDIFRRKREISSGMS